jgi:hypothetical protein
MPYAAPRIKGPLARNCQATIIGPPEAGVYVDDGLCAPSATGKPLNVSGFLELWPSSPLLEREQTAVHRRRLECYFSLSPREVWKRISTENWSSMAKN